jgi:alpha-2-macroglobulin-like protein
MRDRHDTQSRDDLCSSQIDGCATPGRAPALLGWVAFALVGMAACSTDAPGLPGRGGSPDGGAIVGQVDRPANGTISVDESKLSGSISNGTVRFEIPVAVSGNAASGTLRLRVVDVGGAKDISTAAMPFDLPQGGGATLTTTLPAPSSIVEQSDLVRFNVVVDDGTATGLRVARSLMYVIPPAEVKLDGPATLSKGKSVSYRLQVQNPVTKSPMTGVPVALDVLKDDTVVQTLSGETSINGDAVIPVKVDEAGSFTVSASAAAPSLRPKVTDAVTVEAPGPKLLLTTDKPIYKPGQVLHLRALALTRGDSKPIAGEAAIFEIEDAKGNKIFKQSITTSSYGIASVDFTLGQLVNVGTFKARVSVGDVNTEKAVTVSQYALPKFDVAVKTEKAWYMPGDTITGTIDARYFFGQVVSGGDVSIECSSVDVGTTLFQKVVGKLDAQGRWQFSVKLPPSLVGLPLEQGKAAVAMHVTVTDTAQQQVDKSTMLTVARESLIVSLVPDATQIVPGVDNELLAFVTDPLGNPVANAIVDVTAPDASVLTAATDAFGQAVLVWKAPAAIASAAFGIDVTIDGTRQVSRSVNFDQQSGSDHLVVRTDKAVYQIGDTVKVDVTSTLNGRNIYVDWLNDGQAVDMRTLKADQGAASFTMGVDTSLIGSNRIEAYVVDADGNVVRAGRTVFARNGNALAVELATNKTVYGPREPAKLTFSVKDEQGRPAVAALGVQIVDQAVFALVDAHPGLLRTYFELEDTYAKPQYEIAAPSVDFSQLLFGSGTDPAQLKATQNLTKASFAALGQASILGIQHGSWADAVTQATANLSGAYSGEQALLAAQVESLAKLVDAQLTASGCKQTDYSCNGTDRCTAIADGVRQRFVAYDFWGNVFDSAGSSYLSFSLASRGPDERAGTSDDWPVTFGVDDIQTLSSCYNRNTFDYGVPGAAGSMGAGGAMAAGGGMAFWPAADAGVAIPSGAGGASGDTPRVRQDFPETLYYAPAVITGPDGTAVVDVTMADSITDWRVSTLANSADGRLGGGESAIRVFQDFFADINFPAKLTRGDEITFPISVYNYLGVAQSVKLDLVVEDWYTPLGATTKTIDLSPGQVAGVSFPVRVDKVGLRTLTVKAVGTAKSDAVARTVQVVPDGKLVTDTFSGLLAAGAVGRTFDFPVNATPGSPQLYAEVYPGFLSQVVSGMDSILQAPSGCFEQTTSTTWPNVLVTSYMNKTKQLTPAIQLKAESLISAGYQRLLTFEHPGGGFSWFGTQDAAPFLSVTAFGLMEFADMAAVANVDAAMVERTRRWMLSQQQADGSWTGDQSEFFSFHTSKVRNTAFVVWALASGGYKGPELDKGVAYVTANLANEPMDSYTLGLVANALQLAAPDSATTAKVFADLVSSKKIDGDKISWDAGTTQTCFYGSGNDAQVTSTALALSALLLRGGNKDVVDGALAFVTSSKDSDGNFGSTQATIWSLRALLLAASKGSEGAVGAFTVSVDGKPSRVLGLTADQSDVMTTVDLSTTATTGSHAVQLGFVGTGKVSYNVVSKYNVPWSQSPEPTDGPLTIAVSYDKTTIYVNETVKATIGVHNNTVQTENMVLVTVGIPPGFDVITDDLQPYLTSKALSRYDLTGKQLTLYVSKLAASATETFSYRLRANMPVKAADGGGEAYLYYEPDRRVHAAAGVLEAKAN